MCISSVVLLLLGSNISNSSELTFNHLPLLRDPNLKVNLIHKGNFSLEPNQSSPISTMTFVGNDILLLSKNDGVIYRIKNGTTINEPLLDVSVANKRERGLIGIVTSNKTTTNEEYVFIYYTESKENDGDDICLTNYYCQPGTSPKGNAIYRYQLDNQQNNSKLVNPKLLINLPASPGPSHVGGIMKIGPDNNLYFTIGDLNGSVNKSSRY